MSYEQITAETADGVLTITLNRPDRLNAWTPTMGAELIAAFDAADADDAVRADHRHRRRPRLLRRRRPAGRRCDV